jgi:large subunit ribosomal protein L25
MAKAQSTSLTAEPRESAHSRSTRRLRRDGRVPGVLYGRGADPQPFSVDARELRLALAAAGAVLDVALDGTNTSAILKDSYRDPVRGEVLHIDLLRVDLNKPIESLVTLHLTGAEDAPGVKEGGILEQVTREITVEALPNDIPETIEHDVSHMQMHDTELLSAIAAPPNVTFKDDVDETVVASVLAPRAEEVDDEIEAETGIVGEGAGTAEGEAEDADAGDVPAEAGDSGGE